jgi:hypothetical protein
MTIDFANSALRRGRAECDQRLERVKGNYAIAPQTLK